MERTRIPDPWYVLSVQKDRSTIVVKDRVRCMAKVNPVDCGLRDRYILVAVESKSFTIQQAEFIMRIVMGA